MTDPADLATPELPGSRVVVMLGMPGCGKTTRSLERWWSWPRALAIDTRLVHNVGEYPGLIARTPGELAELLEKYQDRERWRITYRGPMAFPVDPARPNGPVTVEPIFDALTDLENALLVVEEADKFCSASFTPGEKAGRGLYAWAHYGRRVGQAVTLCARRAANIPRDVTTTAGEVWAWPVDEPADRDYLKARGFPLDILEELRDHAALVRRRREDGTATFEIVK